MLEDLHHFDSISWSFLTTVAEKMSDKVLVVTTMRPNDGVLSVASRHEEGEMSHSFWRNSSVNILLPSLHLTLAANGLTAYDSYCKWPFTAHDLHCKLRCACPPHLLAAHAFHKTTRTLCLNHQACASNSACSQEVATCTEQQPLLPQLSFALPALQIAEPSTVCAGNRVWR